MNEGSNTILIRIVNLGAKLKETANNIWLIFANCGDQQRIAAIGRPLYYLPSFVDETF